MTPDLRTVAELVRAPAALSVPGDSLAGGAAAGWPFGWRSAALPAASVCLYWAGMALNDYADRDVDGRERPERPIPSGRVSPRFALSLATALTSAGVAAAGLAGGRSALAVALPLAGTVWAYDLVLKETAAGPMAMAAARALDVVLGAGRNRARAALPAALAVGGHTLGVTALSRGEVSGSDRRVPLAALAGTGAVAGTTILTGSRGAALPHRLGALALTATYAASVGGAQADAVQQPTPGRIRRAVGAGILGLMPLQGALATGAGSLRAAVPVVAAFPVARRLARKVSPT